MEVGGTVLFNGEGGQIREKQKENRDKESNNASITGATCFDFWGRIYTKFKIQIE